MSFLLEFVFGWNTSDYEPIQKRTSSRYLIKFWLYPDLGQIIEYQAIFYPKRFLFFCSSIGNAKTKHTPKSDWKYLISPSRSTYHPDWNGNRLRRTGRWTSRNKLSHHHIVRCMQNRFLDQTHLSALSESKVSHQKPEQTSVQTRSDFTDLHVREPLAHRILARTSTPIRHSNRENMSYAMLKVRQLVSKSPSPWYGLSSNKSAAIFQVLDSHWNSRTKHNDNYVRTI